MSHIVILSLYNMFRPQLDEYSLQENTQVKDLVAMSMVHTLQVREVN